MTGPALLLIGHGTRDPEGTDQFFALLDAVRSLRAEGRPEIAETAVEGGFLELSPPPISAAAAQLVSSGANDIVVAPLMLAAAGHVKDDIPAALARERLRHPGVRFRYARDLGIHPELLAIADERLRAVVEPEERSRTAVLLCGRGSSDPDANSDTYKISRLLWEGRPYPLVETCFIGITKPSLQEGLERTRRLGADRIVVLPYFLFTGVLEKRIREICRDFADRHPEMDVRVADPLGPDRRIARIVWERYREALEGDARMNCDLCVHRVALPGFEHKVGEVVLPHYHPDEPSLHIHPDEPSLHIHPDGHLGRLGSGTPASGPADTKARGPASLRDHGEGLPGAPEPKDAGAGPRADSLPHTGYLLDGRRRP